MPALTHVLPKFTQMFECFYAERADRQIVQFEVSVALNLLWMNIWLSHVVLERRSGDQRVAHLAIRHIDLDVPADMSPLKTFVSWFDRRMSDHSTSSHALDVLKVLLTFIGARFYEHRHHLCKFPPVDQKWLSSVPDLGKLLPLARLMGNVVIFFRSRATPLALCSARLDDSNSIFLTQAYSMDPHADVTLPVLKYF